MVRVILFISMVMFCVLTGRAQQSVDPTSATDPNVKIHNTKRIGFLGSGKRAKAKATEKQGEAIQKKKTGKKQLAREARVFQRHNHFAHKEKNGRARQKTSKRSN